jgi:signal transduction histidine kinase
MKYAMVCQPMKRTKKTMKLIKEELDSRIEIQERSLQAYSKEIFENIGQVLSLVKLQIQAENKVSTGKISDPGKLLAKAISDLRNLTKQLSPDEIIKNGFGYAINCELKRLSEAGFCRIEFCEEGTFVNLDEVKELVVFCILQQLTYPVLDMYHPGFIRINVEYLGARIEIEVTREFKEESLHLNIEELAKFKQRLSTINSSISYKNQNWDTLQLTINI